MMNKVTDGRKKNTRLETVMKLTLKKKTKKKKVVPMLMQQQKGKTALWIKLG
eukprot:m.13500 g.13500  ORF g.13500 m.13500 type:complete len:52 (-) comp6884_c0_seq1:91-246(-)